MPRLRGIIIASALLVTLVLVVAPIPVRAAGESYSLSSSPTWAMEGNPGGVSLILAVSNAQYATPTTYAFNWTVTDPSNKTTTSTKSTLSTVSSWSQTATYLTDFGAFLNLAGTYQVNVASVLPATNSSVRKTQFHVGLTDSPNYQRDATVTVSGSGFVPADTVSVQITLGTTPAPGFPTSKTANASGQVILSWQTLPSTPTGTYDVSLAGTSSPAKNPPDLQNFTVYPTNTTANQIWANMTILARTQTIGFKFNATYLNGTPVTTGSAQLKVIDPGGATTSNIVANFDTTRQSFMASYSTNLATSLGTWKFRMSPNAMDDGYGNGGPSSPVTTDFTVQTAALMVQTGIYSETYSDGGLIPISSRILSPDGGDFTQGTVIASITSGGTTVTTFNLAFDQAQGRWTGSYKVAANDPSGTWQLTVSASDIYDNTGQQSSSLNVVTSGVQPSPLTTWLWLIAILAIIGVGCAILIFVRRNVTHREVKLDLQAIHHKAEEVKSDDFLQSIQAQLKRRADRMAKEKEQQKT